MIKAMVGDVTIPINSICKQFGITKPTLYRYVPAVEKQRKEQEEKQSQLI